MHSWLSRPDTPLRRAALWVLVVVSPLTAAFILIRRPHDALSYFFLAFYGFIFICAAWRLIEDRKTRWSARRPAP